MRRLFVLGLSIAAPIAAASAAGCKTTKVIEVVDPSLGPDAGAAGSDAGTAGSGDGETTLVEGESGDLFGSAAKSFARVRGDGSVASVGVVFALSSLTSGPEEHRFQDDLVLEMPEAAREQTLLHHLRANWLPAGHGPDPYGDAHFDFHFLRGSIDEIDAIDCRADKTMPTSDKIPTGYGEPELCVSKMGFHSWPTEDTSGGAFTASLIMGYWKGNVVFLEPMIPVSTFEKKTTFEMAIAKPEAAGGPRTMYPRRMVATWDAAAETYTFEFDAFEPID